MDDPQLAVPARQEFNKKQILEVWVVIAFVATLAFAGGGYAIHRWYDGPELARLDHVIATARRAELEKDSLVTDKIKEGEHALHTLERMNRDFKTVGITGPLSQVEADAAIAHIAYAECAKTTGRTCGPQKPTVVQAGMATLPEKSTRVTNAKRPKASPPKGKNQRAPKHFARNSHTKR